MMTSRLVDLNPQMCITADKGFNYSAQDEAFIVQKKNHFQVYVYFILLSLTYRQLLFKKNPKYSFIFQVTCDVQFNGTPRFISKAAVSILGWTKMHDVFKSLLPRYFLKDIYVK